MRGCANHTRSSMMNIRWCTKNSADITIEWYKTNHDEWGVLLEWYKIKYDKWWDHDDGHDLHKNSADVITISNTIEILTAIENSYDDEFKYISILIYSFLVWRCHAIYVTHIKSAINTCKLLDETTSIIVFLYLIICMCTLPW